MSLHRIKLTLPPDLREYVARRVAQMTQVVEHCGPPDIEHLRRAHAQVFGGPGGQVRDPAAVPPQGRNLEFECTHQQVEGLLACLFLCCVLNIGPVGRHERKKDEQ